jgi:hypothetical protein
MGGSFRAGRRDEGGEQQTFCRALIEGPDDAKGGEPFLRAEPARALRGTDEPGVALPGEGLDDAIGDARRDHEPEPEAKPDARPVARGDALPGPRPLRLEGHLGLEGHGPPVEGLGEELEHGGRVVLVAEPLVAQDRHAGCAVQRDAHDRARGVEVEDAEAATGAWIHADDPAAHDQATRTSHASKSTPATQRLRRDTVSSQVASPSSCIVHLENRSPDHLDDLRHDRVAKRLQLVSPSGASQSCGYPCS